MAHNAPPSEVLQASEPPTPKETRADPATALAWLKDRFTQIYSAQRLAQGIPLVIPMATYMQIYTVIHGYVTTVRSQSGKGPPVGGGDIYHSLTQDVKACCESGREIILRSTEGSSGEVDTQRLVQVYNRLWTAFLDTTNQADHLFRFVERHYVKREIDENRKDIYLIRQLHRRIWAEEILGVDAASGQPVPEKPLDILFAIRQENGKQSQDEESVANVKTAVSSLSTLGFEFLDDGKLHVQSQPQSP
ncbi:Putative cullin repeat-like-containing domain superfamily [Septoria linicola]|uniref:Cullin repeat-like-containing domain superfamily n=1 Tax=Septoria linicola TaxID=215465 RepID=A0A9Q9B1G6_9PEZI|nr:Putative cullin repeat-like-containing domain superfamily [Septoria linicola]